MDRIVLGGVSPHTVVEIVVPVYCDSWSITPEQYLQSWRVVPVHDIVLKEQKPLFSEACSCYFVRYHRLEDSSE